MCILLSSDRSSEAWLVLHSSDHPLDLLTCSGISHVCQHGGTAETHHKANDSQPRLAAAGRTLELIASMSILNKCTMLAALVHCAALYVLCTGCVAQWLDRPTQFGSAI